jgi:pyruvate formate lyase activating enzyme
MSAQSALDFNIPAGALIKTTLVDFPGRVAASFFLKGCNLRCPYCYNTGLIVGGKGQDDESLSSVNDLFSHLEHRKNVLSGLVISGGEPLINPLTPFIIKKARALGYKIKIDTNGTLPDKLESLFSNPDLKPDFIAMDIKTNPVRYASDMCETSSSLKKINIVSLLERSSQLISSFPADSREWRTVLVPPLVKKADITAMASLLPADASWLFAQFRNDNCLDPSYNKIPPYLDRDIAELVKYAKTLIPGAELR